MLAQFVPNFIIRQILSVCVCSLSGIVRQQSNRVVFHSQFELRYPTPSWIGTLIQEKEGRFFSFESWSDLWFFDWLSNYNYLERKSRSEIVGIYFRLLAPKTNPIEVIESMRVNKYQRRSTLPFSVAVLGFTHKNCGGRILPVLLLLLLLLEPTSRKVQKERERNETNRKTEKIFGNITNRNILVLR